MTTAQVNHNVKKKRKSLFRPPNEKFYCGFYFVTIMASWGDSVKKTVKKETLIIRPRKKRRCQPIFRCLFYAALTFLNPATF